MWWKIYFVFLSLLTFSIFFDYFTTLNWTFYDLIGFLSMVIFAIGIYAFTFRKKVFSLLFWKIYFWLAVIWDIIYLLYIFTPLKFNKYLNFFFKSSVYPDFEITSENKLVCIFCTSLLLSLLPTFYMLYRLGYPKKESHKKKV